MIKLYLHASSVLNDDLNGSLTISAVYCPLRHYFDTQPNQAIGQKAPFQLICIFVKKIKINFVCGRFFLAKLRQ